MADMICDYSLDINEDGKVGYVQQTVYFDLYSAILKCRCSVPVVQVDSSDGISDMQFFEAILSKDAVLYLATDSLVAPLIEAIECDEVFGR